MQISSKPICNWPICLTASADERLACIMTFFHSTTSFMNPFLATMAQNWIITNSLLTYTIGPLTFLLHLIFNTTTEHYLRFSCIHLQTFCFQPHFHFTILSHRLSSLSAIKIKSSAYSNSRGKAAHSSLEIISITLTHSRELNTDPWCNPTFTLNALLSPSVVLTTVHRHDCLHQPFLHSCLQ